MKFLNSNGEQKELTYDDVFLVPQYSEVGSRMDVDLTPTDKTGATLPVIIANMTAVAGKRMAETVTRRGGLVVLPQDLNIERIRYIVEYVKSCHPVFESPVVLEENKTVQKALNLIHKRSHKAVIVVDKMNKPVGFFTEKDAFRRDRFGLLKDVMSREMINMPNTANVEEIFKAIKERRVHVMPIIKESGELVGVMTAKGALRSTLYNPAVNQNGKFLTAAAFGMNNNLEHKVSELLSAGVDILVLDAAHGHQKRMIDSIRQVRKIIGPDRVLAAGNAVTSQATRDLVEAGVNIVKVGVGPGAMCSTRLMTGMGRPQFSAVHDCAKTARAMGAHVWADGNIKRPRDAVLALAAGASSAFFASWVAGTYESAADMQIDEHGRLYKEHFGMASKRAVTDRTRGEDIFAANRKKYFEEGISLSRMYLKSDEESVEDIIDKISAGLRSACTYAGARNLEEFYQKCVVGVQTRAGFAEGKAWVESW